MPDLIFTQVPTICKAPPRNTGIYLTKLSRPVPSVNTPNLSKTAFPAPTSVQRPSKLQWTLCISMSSAGSMAGNTTSSTATGTDSFERRTGSSFHVAWPNAWLCWTSSGRIASSTLGVVEVSLHSTPLDWVPCVWRSIRLAMDSTYLAKQ